MADPILDAFGAPSFSVDDEAYLLRGEVDPSAGSGVFAPASSVFLRRTVGGVGQLFLKTGPLDTDWTDVSSSAGGTVTSVSTTQPSEGLTITGGPITTTGTFTFALANDLAAVEALTGMGIAVRTNTDTWATRSLTSSNGTLTIVNPSGVVGNPSLDLTAVGTAGTYNVVVTDAYGRVTSGNLRSIIGTANQVTVANGNFSANPTIAIADNPVLPGTASFRFPSGTTAQEPSPATNGDARYDSTLNLFRFFQNGMWVNLSSYVPGQGSILRSWVASIGAKTGTNNIIPFDNTVPLSTEGVQIATQTITPLSTSSKFIFMASFYVDCSGGNKQIAVTAFRGTTNIGVAANQVNTSGKAQMLAIIFHDEPTTASPITYSFRIGTNTNATWYLNQGSTAIFGGALANHSLMILETT